jgi:hypothetical protein
MSTLAPRTLQSFVKIVPLSVVGDCKKIGVTPDQGEST